MQSLNNFSIYIYFFNGGRDPQKQKCPGPMKVIRWPWPSPWLMNAAGFPCYTFQSPDLFLWDWCLFLDSWVLRRQYQEVMPIPGQGMSEISWQHGRLEGEILEGGSGESILGTSGIMLSIPVSNLTTGRTHPPGGGIYSFHCWWEYDLVQTFRRIVWQCLATSESMYFDPTILLPGIHLTVLPVQPCKDKGIMNTLFMMVKTQNSQNVYQGGNSQYRV